MSILICAATPKELAALAPNLFPRPDSMPEMQPMRGPVKHGHAIFMATGVGPINAALALGHCIGLANSFAGGKMKLEAILYAGLAGAFDLELAPLRSIWRVNREIWPEYGLNDGASVTARAFSHALWTPKGKEPIYDSLELGGISGLPGASMKGEEWPACASITVAGVTASFARRNALWDAWHVPLENMEGFAAAYAAARAEIPFVEIRVVSNKAGPRAREEKDFEGALKTLGEILPTLNLL